ncbi:hypothetical protein [Streptomyces diastaticus]|uniref:hypothetical protein n=2 Tax=Bacillati TaxID=1783272 RepID=UPI003656C4F2
MKRGFELIKKSFISLGMVLLFISMFASTSFAASEGAVKTVTNNKSYTGITADIVLPTSIRVNSGYVNWYLGIGAAKVEGGISKTPTGYKVFLNTGYNESSQNSKYWNSQFDSTINDGDRVNLKLVNNGDGTISMYVNGNLRYKQPVYGTLGLYEQVKMVQGVEDNGTNSFSQASFSNVQLRANTTGSVYHKWDGTIPSTFSRYGSYGSDFYVYSQVPLSSKLR